MCHTNFIKSICWKATLNIPLIQLIFLWNRPFLDCAEAKTGKRVFSYF